MTRRIAVTVPLVALLAAGAFLSLARSGAGAPPSVGLIEKEFLFTPKDVVVGAGGSAFVVDYEGAIQHNFVLDAPGRKTVVQMDGIQPGQTTGVTAPPPRWRFAIQCELPG